MGLFASDDLTGQDPVLIPDGKELKVKVRGVRNHVNPETGSRTVIANFVACDFPDAEEIADMMCYHHATITTPNRNRTTARIRGFFKACGVEDWQAVDGNPADDNPASFVCTDERVIGAELWVIVNQQEDREGITVNSIKKYIGPAE